MTATTVFQDITNQFGLTVHHKTGKDVNHFWVSLTPNHKLFCFDSEPRFLTLSIKGDGTHRIDTLNTEHIEVLERICKRLANVSEKGDSVICHSPETVLESFLRSVVKSDSNAHQHLKSMVSRSGGLYALNTILGVSRDEVRGVLMDCLIDIVPDLESHLVRQLDQKQQWSF